MARHKDTLTLSVPFGTKEQLDELARRHGLMWGESPSSSKLITAIASGQLGLDTRTGFSETQIEALGAGIDALLHRGKHQQARTLATTLLASQGLPEGDRQVLMNKLQGLSSPWLDTIERLRRDRQPFLITYQGSKGSLSSYTARGADVVFHDGTAYAEVYADETDRSVDLPELVHNRCLRLDRIQSIVELPGDTRWHGELASTEVTIKIAAHMLKFYQADHPEISPVALEDGEAYLVSRRIRFSWWFLRDLLERGPGFEIVAPQGLRQKLRESLEQMLAAHQ